MNTRRNSRRDRRASMMMRSFSIASLGVGAIAASSAHADILRENFNAGLPASWSLVDYRPLQMGESSAFNWGVTSSDTYDNYTGGDGLAAMADSDTPGDGIEYDVALLTPRLSLPSEQGLTLSFLSNYQNLAGSDFADIDVRVGESEAWINLLRWNEDHGDSFGNPIGEEVVLSLDQFAGQDVQFRFHYYDPNDNDWNWYWQVDNLVVTPAPGAGALGAIAAAGLMRRRRR